MIVELQSTKDLALVKPALHGMRVGLTSGCYDLLHPLHLHFLRRCRRHCDVLVVGVDSDNLVQHFKNKSPVIAEHHRAAMVDALECTTIVFVMETVLDFSRAVDIFGARQIFKNKAVLYGQEIVGADRAEVVVIPDIEQLDSTTAIVEKIRAGKP